MIPNGCVLLAFGTRAGGTGLLMAYECRTDPFSGSKGRRRCMAALALGPVFSTGHTACNPLLFLKIN